MNFIHYKIKIFGFVLLMILPFAIFSQKVFQMGTQKMKSDASISQAEVMWVKDKKTYVICPQKRISGNFSGLRSILIFDNKGKKESEKTIVIDNDQKKVHNIEKLMIINSRVFCLHSFYDKSEKKYTLFQTSLAETDGQPEGLGRELLGIEIKNPDEISGIEVVFSNDSSKILVIVCQLSPEGKEKKLSVHNIIINKDDFSFDRDVIFKVDNKKKSNIRTKSCVSNQGSVYMVSYESVEASAHFFNLYITDNEDKQQVTDIPRGDMKRIVNFDVKIDRMENLVIGGAFNNKSNILAMSGSFLYIFNIGKNEFTVTNVIDNDDEMSAEIRKVQEKNMQTDLIKPGVFHLYIDAANNYYLVGQQFELLNDYKSMEDMSPNPSPGVDILLTNLYIILVDNNANVKWQKTFTGRMTYAIWDNNRINIITQEERELRLNTVGFDKVVKYSKGASPTEPDHKLDTRNFRYVGDGRVGAIGHAMNGSKGFYLDFFDLNTIEIKGKIENDKKKKKNK